MILTAEQQRRIRKHAETCYPCECCGFILRDGSYVEAENIHAEPETDFRIADDFYMRYAAQVVAVVHSHPVGTISPSKADMKCQQTMDLPWVIVPMHKEQALEPYVFGDGVPIVPLTERPYISGVYDCYTCVRDYFRAKHGIVLANPPRNHDWYKGEDADLMDHFIESQKGTFRTVPIHELQPEDILAFRIKSRYVNHVGLYLGNEDLLHHVRDQLSCVENIARYMKRVVMIMRINR